MSFEIILPARRIEFAELQQLGMAMRAECARGEAVELAAPPAERVTQALIGLEGWCSAVDLLPPDTGTPYNHSATDPGVRHLSTESFSDRQSATLWRLYSSGTTGAPKPIAHTLHSLSRTAVVSDRTQSFTWGLLYDPCRMAGIQVILQSLVAGTPVAIPDPTWGLRKKVAWLIGSEVTALSATPTLWRQILQTGLADRWNLRQVTLGGEIADQQILDSLAAHFPDARISHVFASTETAAAFAVHDGIAGFPTSQLIENPAGIRMRIRDGILEIHNPFSSNADEDGFVTTGDEVVEENGRVLFLGRRSGVANIGGTKVWPEQVENQLRRHPAVADALVNAKRNPFTGSVLVAAVTLAPGEDCDGLSLRKWLKQRLPSTHVPATITVVDALETNPTGKVLR